MRPSLRLPPPVMMNFPVGALLDIPTGEYLTGTHDQRVLLAGLANITGVVGPGNCFKTTIMRYMILSALARMFYVIKDDGYYSSYDTEINVYENRPFMLTQQFDAFKGRNILDEGLWQITNKVEYPGNEYWSVVKQYLKEKTENKKKKMFKTAFLSRDKVSPMEVPCPTMNDFDSLTHFITSDVEKTLETTELGDSAGNTVFMRQGLSKAKMLMEMPSVAGANFNFFAFTAHIGQAIAMPSGPGTPPPRKQLSSMRQGEVIKGVTNNFFYLLHNCWMIDHASPFINQGTKAPEYPYEPGDEQPGDQDLNIVTMKQLRGKNGGTGFAIQLLVSQREGVLPYLSEFHYCKLHDRYGLEGSDRNYQLSLCPDVSLSRTTVRSKLRESKKLQRAMEITSQLCQIEIFHPFLRKTLMKPGELYAKLTELGYDWDFILNETRSYHTLDDEEYPGYPLSTLDLCRIARGEYHPYWLESDCKTIKPEFANKKMKLEPVHAESK